MTKFFLALIGTGVATLIGAIVIATFRVPDPFLHRPQSLRAAPSPSGRLLRRSRATNHPAHRRAVSGPETILRFRPIAMMFGDLEHNELKIGK